MPTTNTDMPLQNDRNDTGTIETCTCEENILTAEQALRIADKGPADYFADYNVRYSIAHTLLALTKLLYVALTDDDEQGPTDWGLPPS